MGDTKEMPPVDGQGTPSQPQQLGQPPQNGQSAPPGGYAYSAQGSSCIISIHTHTHTHKHKQ